MVNIKKIIFSIAPILFTGVVLICIFITLNLLEKSYDFQMWHAKKIQSDFPEYVDFFGELEPQFPDKMINSKTILGIDVNANGIRDDIDVWINRIATDENETKAMRQYSLAKQEWLNVCEKKEPKVINAVNLKLENAVTCLMALSGYQRKDSNFTINKLELLILNTKERLSCVDFYPKNATSNLNSIGTDTNFYCEFEIQNIRNVVSGNILWQKSTSKR